MNYSPHYTHLLNSAAISQTELPQHLKHLMEQFEICLKAWQNASPEEQAIYKTVLEKTDAVIAAEIFKYIQTSYPTPEKHIPSPNENTTNEKGTSRNKSPEQSTTAYNYKLSELLKQANELDF